MVEKVADLAEQEASYRAKMEELGGELQKDWGDLKDKYLKEHGVELIMKLDIREGAILPSLALRLLPPAEKPKLELVKE